MHTKQSSRGGRPGVTLIELVLVLTIMSTIMALGLPRLQIGAMRVDAAAQQVRSVFQTAQRTSLTRQYDVIVSVDTIKGGLRIAEDVNNNGAIEVSEWKFWRPLGENNRFRIPPIGMNNSTPSKSVVGSQLTSVDQLPSIIFHRDGSASTDAEMYVASTWRGRVDYRVVSLTRSTGRAEILRLMGTGSSATWGVGIR